jgi:DNA primase
LVFKDEHGEEQRILASDVREHRDAKPKYWNETFPKGEVLFGFDLAKHCIAQWGFAILVEGQMDVISLHSRGLSNTVGVLGGAFTPFHAKILSKWTRRVVILMDHDVPGRQHATKTKAIMDVYESNPAVWTRGSGKRMKGLFDPLSYLDVLLPEKSDPDSFVRRHGGWALRKRIMDASLESKWRLPEDWLRSRTA